MHSIASSEINLKHIIDKDLQGLLNLQMGSQLLNANPIVKLYAKIKLDFLCGNTMSSDNIDNFVKQGLSLECIEVLNNLNELLFQIQRKTVQNKLLEHLSLIAPKTGEIKEALGEILFYIGLGWIYVSKIDKALETFVKSEQLLNIIGAYRLRVSVQYNVLHCQSLLYESKNFTTAFSFLSQEALKYSNYNVYAVIESRLSEQFTLRGDFETALMHANKSIENLEQRTYGRDYYFARLNRAYINLLLSRKEVSLTEVKEVLIAPFEDVNLVAFNLKYVLLQIPIDLSKLSKLDKKWQKRFEALLQCKPKSNSLSPIQTTVLEKILHRPMNKYDLIGEIYKSKDNIIVLENRLKNILNKINKKYPKLVNCKSGSYYIENKSHAEFILKLNI